ncbi:hypothetical protein J6590_069692 [Homalodisca vitripennis]|nr:hypothetical protein J6590_069692 [Homalodisca vitripennis]
MVYLLSSGAALDTALGSEVGCCPTNDRPATTVHLLIASQIDHLPPSLRNRQIAFQCLHQQRPSIVTHHLRSSKKSFEYHPVYSRMMFTPAETQYRHTSSPKF